MAEESNAITLRRGDRPIAPVTPAEREARHGHRGCIVWLTGLSGAGKTTLSQALERALFDLGAEVTVLDGDNIRHGLNANLGFSREDRQENIRRVAEVATLLSQAGIITVAAFISPYRADRLQARAIANAAGQPFIEAYLDAPVSLCEQRDVKGLYRRARAGELPDFTGVSAPYEPPLEAELTIHTDRESVSDSVARVLATLGSLVRLPPSPR